MSNINCPYDGNFCQKKYTRFDTWQKFVMKTDGMIFPINPELFADCPVEQPQGRTNQCDRYARYLVESKKIQSELVAQHEQR